MQAIGLTLAELKRSGTPAGRADAMATYSEFATIVDLHGHQAWADRFGG